MFVYIYGAGVYAKRCYEEVVKFGFTVKAFVVTDKANNPKELFDIPVVGVDDFGLPKESILIVALKEEFRPEVEKALNGKGITNFFFYPNASILDFLALVSLTFFVCKSRSYKFVYIYGAGVYGQFCLKYLRQRNVKVDGVLVTELENNPKKIDDVPLLKYNELSSPKKDTLILVALKPMFRDQVLPMLVNMGYENYAVLKDDPCIKKMESEIFGCMPEVCDKQKKIKFHDDVKVSILTPLYNTREDFLREMIASVLGQSYENWELCLADGSDMDHFYVRRICEKNAAKDKRIKYKKLSVNKGISENTNACFDFATGDYYALLDHDDLLHPAALYEMMKVISRDKADFIYTDEATFQSPNLREIITTNFKPDFAPDYLNGLNYICHFTAFSKGLLKKVGKFRPEFDGAQDYDLFLRMTEKAKRIRHIPKCLYYWRASEVSTALSGESKKYTCDAGMKALQAHFKRCGVSAVVNRGLVDNTYRIKYEIFGEPLVSIIIPSCDHWQTLKKCVDSILNLSTYKNYEILVVENNSKFSETFEYYERLKQNSKIKIINYDKKFNYSAINNYAVKYAAGKFLLFLNNDIEVISSDWIEEMLMYAQRKNVGAVGAMLYYPSNKIQHAGVVVGLGGVAGHSHKEVQRGTVHGYARRLLVPQNFSAVTAACMMVPRKVFDLIKGFDEILEVALNDVDFCLRIRRAGYYIVWTPFAELYHYESESRGYEDTPEKMKRAFGEQYYFKERWNDFLQKGDPFYNVNLTLDREDFTIRDVETVFHN